MTKFARSSWRQSFVGMGLIAALSVFSTGCSDDDGQVPTPGPTDEEQQGEGEGNNPGTGAPSTEMDAALIRLNTDGSLDTSYGTGGISRIDFGTGYKGFQDSLFSIALDPDGRAVLFGHRKGEGDRIDLDRVVARATTSGQLDTTFATEGMHILNIGGLNDQARHGIVQGDGKILASGYTNQPTGVANQSENRIVLVRLNADGTPDNAFGVEGVVNDAPFVPSTPNTKWGMAEAYAAGQLSTGEYVTTGYGRTAPSGGSARVDMVSFLYGANGTRDTSFGVDGVAKIDVVGQNDRGRNLVVLPDDRTVVVGSVEPASGNIDAMVSIVNPDGTFDTTFGDGEDYRSWSFERPDDAFFGVAASADGNWIAAVGHRAGAAGGVEEDDDAVLALIPVGGTGTEFVQPVPLSETESDRFLAAAFAGDKVYASGYIVNAEGNSRMVVARFNLDGTRDASFGTEGVVTVDVAVGGSAEAARGIAVQSDGKIVIGGAAER